MIQVWQALPPPIYIYKYASWSPSPILAERFEVLCPFNCSNAFSHTGVLRCQNTSWEVPKCFKHQGFWVTSPCKQLVTLMVGG